MKGDGVRITFDEIRPGDRILYITRFFDGDVHATEGDVANKNGTSDSWWTARGDMVASRTSWVSDKCVQEVWLVERPGPKEPTLFGAVVKFGGADPHLAVLAPVLSPKQWVGKYANYTWTEILAQGDVEIISEGVETNG